METVVKYRFDKEMVSFVKKLDIKTSMFGYDKNDVYSKFKDLLIKARSVCEELVLEEHRAVEQMKLELIEAAKDPEELDKLLAKWKREAPFSETKIDEDEPASLEDPVGGREGESVDAGFIEDLSDEIEIIPVELTDSEQSIDIAATASEADAIAVSSHDDISAVYISSVVVAADNDEEDKIRDDMQEAYQSLLSEHETLIEKLSEMESQLSELQVQLSYYEEREEELNRTADILREARLEGEAIVHSARTRAEQEIFLFRAKRRDEEKAFKEVLKGMEARRENLIEVCALYQSYIDEGRGLLDQLQEYASRFTRPMFLESDNPPMQVEDMSSIDSE